MIQPVADKILSEMRANYRKAAVEVAPMRTRMYADEIRSFSDYAREGESILDIGCGDGRVFEIFKGKGVSYAGIDVSEEAIDKAKSRWSKEIAEGRADFHVGDILRIPVEDGRYDAVVAAGVLHHVPSEEYRARAVSEMARGVRPGGYVLIAVWNLWRMKYWGVLLHQLFGKRNNWDFGDLKVSWRKSRFSRYYHAFRMVEIRKLCEVAGLEVVEQNYVRKGVLVGWARGENLVTIARKPIK